MPATPMATLVMPSRQGLPNESETITASSEPALRERLAQPCGRRVRVHGQEADYFVSGDVRGVHAGVCADEAVMGLGDDQAAVHTDYAAALAQDDLDLARVFAVAGGEGLGESRRLDRAQVQDGPRPC